MTFDSTRSQHHPDCDEQGPCVDWCRYEDPDDANDSLADARWAS